MAIDRNKTRAFIQDAERTIRGASRLLPRSLHKGFRIDALIGAINEAVKLVEGSRPPVFYISGADRPARAAFVEVFSGHGFKMPARRKASEDDSTRCTLTFPGRHAAWDFVLTEHLGAGANVGDDGAVAALKDDFETYRPDVLLHLIPAAGAVKQRDELRRVNDFTAEVANRGGRRVRTVFVLEGAEALGDSRAWPPEAHPHTAGRLQTVLEKLRGSAQTELPIDLNLPFRGYQSEDPAGSVLIPIGNVDRWNVDRLITLLGARLPENTLIHYYQAIGRENELRALAQAVTRRFATMAAGIGSTPLPLADVLVITPLQFLLVAIVGGLAGRPVGRETVFEYAGAAGINLGAGYLARHGARQALKLIPGAGHLVSGAIAGATTWSIGRAAEAYFFAGELRDPKEFEEEFAPPPEVPPAKPPLRLRKNA